MSEGHMWSVLSGKRDVLSNSACVALGTCGCPHCLRTMC